MWVNGRMEETTVKLTFVGAIVIVAVAVFVLLAIGVLLDDDKSPPQSGNAATQ
jgi:hypothetical protein